MPQIEVKFDIDANGILNVSAKDLGTGKEAKVRIEQSSGLSESEIKEKLREAEENAEEDKRNRNLAELRNQGESMCFQLEKMMKEQADKLKDSDKTALESAIKKVRDTSKEDNADAIKSAIEQLEQASHAFSKTLYEATQGAQAAGAAGSAPGGEAGSKPAEEDAIDAEFEVKE